MALAYTVAHIVVLLYFFTMARIDGYTVITKITNKSEVNTTYITCYYEQPLKFVSIFVDNFLFFCEFLHIRVQGYLPSGVRVCWSGILRAISFQP